MPVPFPMPYGFGKWPPSAFGCLGEWNTSLFRGPPRKRGSSRLFLWLVAGKEPLPNVDTGVAIGIAAHITRGAEHQWRARSIARGRLSLAVPRDLRFTVGALAARIAWIHPAGDDPFSPRLVLTVAEDL